MRYFLTILVIILLTDAAKGQDSLSHKVDSVLQLKNPRVNSLRSRVSSRIDSVNRQNEILSHRIDSLQNIKVSSMLSDTIGSKLTKQFSVFEEARGKLQREVDSLTTLGLPHEQLSKKLDSLNQRNPLKKINTIQTKVESAQSGLENKVNQPLGKVNQGISKLNNEAEGYSNLPSSGLNAEGIKTDILPGNTKVDLNAPDLSLNKSGLDTDGLNVDLKTDVNLNVGDKISKAGAEVKIPDGVNDLSKVSEKVSTYGDDVKSITSGNLQDVKQLDKDALSKISNDQFKAAEGELTEATAQMESIKSLKDQEAFKKRAIEKSREMVMQQIALYESEITGSVHKLSKYQKRTGTILSKVKDFPKRPLTLKKPPFIERIIPALTFQVQKSSLWWCDLNPSVHYRIRSIFSAGIGYNARLVFDKHFNFHNEDRIHGFRSFYELSILKGLWIRADIERMQVTLPLILVPQDTDRTRVAWNYLVGIKKDFSVASRVLGNVQFMYNIYSPAPVSLYANKFNVRFGFQFQLKR